MAHVTFIHGIGNKTEPERLLREWKIGLCDNDGPDLDELGVTTSMVYWADMLYANPVSEQTRYEALEVDAIVDAEDADLRWLDDLSAEERGFVEALGHKVGLAQVNATTDEDEPDQIEPGSTLEAVPLPPWLKKRLMRVFLRDVHHFLYDTTFSPRPGETYNIGTDVRARALGALTEGAAEPGPHLVVGHSLGSVIAYDALTGVDNAPPIDVLMTVGSPLGISEVRDGLTPPWTAENSWPTDSLSDGNWWNVFDPLDPVCGVLDRRIAPHYQRGGQELVADIGVTNSGYWRHSIAQYLGQPALRSIVWALFR